MKLQYATILVREEKSIAVDSGPLQKSWVSHIGLGVIEKWDLSHNKGKLSDSLIAGWPRGAKST